MSMPSRLATLIFTACTLTACGNADVITNTYATAAEARQAGAIDRGWMPPFIPPGAHDLREAHDVDTNRRWGLFNFVESDDAIVRAAVNSEEVSLDGHTCDAPRRIEWWPVMLRGRLHPEDIRTTGLSTYAARDVPGMIVAVNWKQRRAYYWMDSRS
jgi:hypothetical protein